MRLASTPEGVVSVVLATRRMSSPRHLAGEARERVRLLNCHPAAMRGDPATPLETAQRRVDALARAADPVGELLLAHAEVDLAVGRERCAQQDLRDAPGKV